MRLSISTVAATVLLASSAAAREARVYLSNGNGAPATHALTPETARLVFAHRLGLGQQEEVKAVNDETIEALNAFGGRPQKLFGQDESISKGKVLIMVDNVHDVEDVRIRSDGVSMSSFSIPNPPDSISNTKLLRYFDKKRTPNDTPSWMLEEFVSSLSDVDSSLDSNKWVHDGRVMIHMTVPHGDESAHHTLIAQLDKIISGCNSREWDWTLALMPADSPRSSGIFSKRDEPSTWGTDLGSGRPDFLPGELNHDTNVANPPHSPSFAEDIYVEHPSSSSSQSSGHKDSWLDSFYPFSSSDDTIEDATPAWKAPVAEVSAANDWLTASNTSAPVGILPQCYSTESACEAATHGCSGHGSCSLKFKDPDAPAGSSKGACYSCMCKPTKRTNKDGTIKTFQWTGPACQKKDVSFEFWLLGGVTVAMVSVVAWGIGLLMTMGSQELPSVIGAGVAGPRAKQ